MTARFAELVGPRILRPLGERITLEVIPGGLLPERTRYHPRGELAALVAQCVEGGSKPLLDAIHAVKSKYKQVEEELRAKVRTEVEGAGGKITLDVMNRWHQNVDTGEWLESVVQGGVDRGLYPAPESFETTSGRFPSAWTFIEVRMARLVATIGEGRRISESDDADMRHAAAGPYFDVMVTDDQDLRRTLDVVRNPPFRFVSSLQFTKELDLAH